MAETKVWPAAVVAILALILCTGLIIWKMPAVPSEIKANVDNSAIQASIGDLSTKIDSLSNTVSTIQAPSEEEKETVPSSDKIDSIYNEILKEDLKEAKAEELANLELSEKDFKKAVKDAIDNFCDEEEECDGDLEEYQDITEISLVDTETIVDEVDEDTAEVELTLKIYYFIDGDEEETQKARILATFEVTGLDPEESYEDAEVDNFDIEVLRIYE